MKPSLRRQLLTSVSTLILIAAVVAVGSVSRARPDRFLMIHSDDAGMSEAVNAATVDAMERGVVKSTSIMVCCPGFREFAKYASEHPQLDYGVHLTLTAELTRSPWGPVLPRETVPSLVDENGNFWRKADQVAQHATLDDAERELRAQIRRAQDAGIRLSHLDHHMWVLYTRVDLIDLYVRLALEFNLSPRIETRPPREDVVDRGPEIVAAYFEARDRFEDHGMPIFDFIETDNYNVDPEKKRAYYLRQIRALPIGVSQFVVHCSYSLPGKVQPPGALGRVADAQVFTSLEIANEMRRLDINPIDYSQFREMIERQADPNPSGKLIQR